MATDAGWWTGPIDRPRRFVVDDEAIDGALAGGEGLVYHAVDTERDVTVALKLMTTVSISDYGRLVERAAPFEMIDHPNLMKVVDVFIGTALTRETDPDVDDFDVIYTVSEWIDGEPLSQIADSTDAVNLMRHVAGVARALAALHALRTDGAPHGVVHRDVKPSNVRVSLDGDAVLVDFGVARPLDADDMTEGVGTYRWRAPEVLSGSASVTTAVDAWGLGAVAYWCLTGEPPGLDGASAARERLAHAPKGAGLRDPVGVAGHIAQLLETNPHRRPSDLHVWARQLDAIVERGRRPIRRRTAVASVAGLLAVPAVIAFASVGDDDTAASSTTNVVASSIAATSAAESEADGTSLALDNSTDHDWRVDCLGEFDALTLTGAEPGELIRADVHFADGTVGDPVSYLQAGTGTTSSRNVVRADGNGTVDVAWFCDRREVGVPIDLTMTGVSSGRTLGLLITSEELASGLDIGLLTNWEDAPFKYRMPVGATVEAYVIPRTNGDDLPAMSRNFDPRMQLSSSDPSIMSTIEVDKAFPEFTSLAWNVTAEGPGRVTLRAEIPGTDHVGTIEVEVFDLPNPPRSPDGTFAPGAMTPYLMEIYDSPAVALYTGSTEPTAAPGVVGVDTWNQYTPFLPACGDHPEFSQPTWVQAERLQPLEPPLENIPPPSFSVLTFADAAAAREWSLALRAGVEKRVGQSCQVAMFEVERSFDPVEDVSEREWLMRQPSDLNFASVGISAHTVDNVVVVVLGFDGDLKALREALAAT